MHLLSPKELLILSNLRNNARLPLTTLSKQTNIPVSTIYGRLKEQEKSFITKHTSLLDFRKLGYDIRVNIVMKTTRDKRDQLREFLFKNRSVNTAFRVSNGYDFSAECIFKNMEELQKFLEKLDNLNVEENIFYIMDEIKRESFLTKLENSFPGI